MGFKGSKERSDGLFQRPFCFLMAAGALVVMSVVAGSVPGFACDPARIEWVTLVPGKVEVPLGGEVTVSTLVHCRTNGGDFIDPNTAQFEIRLVDVDDDDVDVLDAFTETIVVPSAKNFRIDHTIQVDFTLRCTPNGIEGLEASEEGDLLDPVELALQIDQGATHKDFSWLPYSNSHTPPMAASAHCVRGLVDHDGELDPATLKAEVTLREGNALQNAGLALIPTLSPPANILTGTYEASALVTSDPSVLGVLVDLPDRIDVDILFDEVLLSGGNDWIELRGHLNDDGSFTATGNGQLQRLGQASGRFEGTFAHGQLTGTLSLALLEASTNKKPITYQIEARGQRWANFWQGVAEQFQDAAKQTATVQFNTAALGTDLSPLMADWTGGLLKAMAFMRFGPAQRLNTTLLDIAKSIDDLASQFGHTGLAQATEVRLALNRSADALVEAERWYAKVLEASIVPKVVARVSVESVLDGNANNRIDDDEILKAVRLWISGNPVPNTLQVIDDTEVLVLVELWTLGRIIKSSAMTSSSVLLNDLIESFLDKLDQAGRQLQRAGTLLLQ